MRPFVATPPSLLPARFGKAPIPSLPVNHIAKDARLMASRSASRGATPIAGQGRYQSHSPYANAQYYEGGGGGGGGPGSGGGGGGGDGLLGVSASAPTLAQGRFTDVAASDFVTR